MIEVEKKFQPTEEQLAALLKDCEFIREVKLHDLYYDYPDYSLWKKEIYLRKRNDGFELKIQIKDTGAYEELEDEESIKKFFKTTQPLTEFIKENFILAVDFTTTRKKYKNGEFVIDIDELNFGYKCVEIELLVADETHIEEGWAKIFELAEKYGFSLAKVPTKRKEYFRKVKPEVYNLLYN